MVLKPRSSDSAQNADSGISYSPLNTDLAEKSSSLQVRRRVVSMLLRALLADPLSQLAYAGVALDPGLEAEEGCGQPSVRQTVADVAYSELAGRI